MSVLSFSKPQLNLQVSKKYYSRRLCFRNYNFRILPITRNFGCSSTGQLGQSGTVKMTWNVLTGKAEKKRTATQTGYTADKSTNQLGTDRIRHQPICHVTDVLGNVPTDFGLRMNLLHIAKTYLDSFLF